MKNAVTAVVFVNPRAGGGKAARYLAKLRAAFAEKKFEVQFVQPNSVEGLRAEIRAAIAQGRRTLIAMGGDGTLQALVREALGNPVLLGVIPLGGGNDFAAALGVHNWKSAVEAIVMGNCREVDIARVSFADGTEAVYAGGGGIGLDAEAMRYASGILRKWPGRLRYIAAAVLALRRRYAGIEVEMEFPETERPRIAKRVLLASLLNTPSYGGGLSLAPQARIDDGMLDVAVLEPLGILEIVKVLPRLMSRGELRSKKLMNFQVTEVKLAGSDRGWFHGDGELLGRGECEVKVLAGAIRVLAPKTKN